MPLLVHDWTGPSERALDLLSSLNGIVEKALVFHDIKLNDKDDAAVNEKECKKKLDNCCKKLKSAGIKAEPHVGAGDVLEEILRISRERKASMIIIGTTCKDRLHEMFQGSISHEVTRISELPTLLVP
jgi:nucleotide-binding universal stress UspA family protein